MRTKLGQALALVVVADFTDNFSKARFPVLKITSKCANSLKVFQYGQ